MDKLWVCSLLLGLVARHSAASNTGYVLTLPKIVQAGVDETFCLTLHGIEDDAQFTLSFVHKEKDEEFEYTYTFREGLSKCDTFPVPSEPGTYEVALKNSTDVISDIREIEVKSGNLITFIQTDKPIYRPGESVKFRVLTLKRDLKSRRGKIEEIFIKTPNDIRVKQWLNVLSDGLASFNYPMPQEPKLGEWTIEVTLDGDTTTQTFKVEKYVLPKFEVTITPPVFILANADVIEGEVCASYTYGKPVNGALILELCLVLYGSFGRPCARHTLNINGCQSFSVNTSEMMMKSPDYHLFGSELHILATVREWDTGLEVNKTHKGVKVTFDPIKLVLEDDTNGYFKPMFPYHGRVVVTKPDGSVAPNELIEVNAVDYHNDIRVARNYTTDEDGVVMFTVCDVLTDKTADFSIEAKALLYSDPENLHPVNKLYMPRAYRSVKQWYSPSQSYIVIPRDNVVHRCGEEITLTIPYTTTLNSYTTFYYQVVARGRIQHTSHKTHHFLHHDSTEYIEVSQEQCLLPLEEEELLPTNQPTPIAQATSASPLKTEEGEDSVPSVVFMAEPMIVPETYHHLGGVRRKRSSILSSEGQMMEEDDTNHEETNKESETVLPPIRKSEHISHFTIRFPLTAEMSPKASLLVYYVREDGETVADSIDFKIESCFENKVKFEFEEESVLPGGETTLHLEATPGSVCSVGVVDKSVNIIGGDHQLTSEKVFEKLASYSLLSGSHSYYSDRDYCEEKIKKEEAKSGKESDKAEEPDSEPYFGWWHYSSRYVDAIQAFRQMGLQVITNLVLETRPCSKEYPIYYDVGMSPRAFAMSSEMHNVEQTLSGNPTTQLRSYFPETWLWHLKIVGDNGRLSVPLTAPHTITKWVGNSVCVSETAGLGISPMASITTFQPFFLSFTLPYAAVRGERIPIMITVYNYLDKCLHIQVNLETDKGISVIIRKHQKLPFCLCGGKSRSQTYFIEPKYIGQLPITATAEIVPGMCGNSLDMDQQYIGLKDAVRREIFVKAEGVTQQYSKGLYLCSKGSSVVEEVVELALPPGVVAESSRGHVTVIGDLMGPVLSNLDHLIELPTGCGEQTMISFSPNIYVLKYLTSTSQLTEEIETLAKKYMEIGYNRELNYRHPDGSFSAFGERDDSGSTWLTAFVVKSFAEARDFMYIDQMDLERSMSFLKTTAMENGCFREVGKVFSSYMMGGLGRKQDDVDDTALTAFVLIALLKANVLNDDPVLKSAIRCLNRQPLDEMDVYTLAIVSYANVLNDPTDLHTEKAMEELFSRIKSNGLLQHWRRLGSTPHANNIFHMAASAEVETTSYGLLATLGYYGDKAVTKGQPIVLWLSQQRNAFGGFSSTQDTVVGLNALSEFAARLYAKNKTDLSVRVQGQRLDNKFKVRSGVNTLLLQSARISSLPNTITIRVNGTGCALVQANVLYNQIPKNIDITDPRFHLMIEVRRARSNKNDCAKRLLRTCVGYSSRPDLSSGMSMMTVKMVTGWTPIEESLKELRSVYAILNMKRHEYNEKEAKLVFYFDEMDSRRRCFDFEVEQNRDLALSAPKPAELEVFQYYEKDVTIIKSYKIKTTCGTKAEIPLDSDQRVKVDIRPEQIRSGGRQDSAPASQPIRKRMTKFLSKSANITVRQGEEAILPCAVKGLGSKAVTWKKMSPAKLITVGEKIFASKNHFYMRRPGKNLYSPEWNLHIRDVQLNDSGIYECQVGTKDDNLEVKITLNVTGPVAPMKKSQEPIGCPLCLTRKPDNFRDIICKSDAVYKVISGRNGKLPMKIKANLRTRRKQKLDVFVNFTIGENCICSLINPPRGKNRSRKVKRILLVMRNVTLSDDTRLTLDSKSYLINIDNNKSLEQEARRQVRRCKRRLT